MTRIKFEDMGTYNGLKWEKVQVEERCSCCDREAEFVQCSRIIGEYYVCYPCWEEFYYPQRDEVTGCEVSFADDEDEDENDYITVEDDEEDEDYEESEEDERLNFSYYRKGTKWLIPTCICSLGGCEYHFIECLTKEEAFAKALQMSEEGKKMEVIGACPTCYSEYLFSW
ncbi:hypothetical protein J6TS7_29530 [Paenibacillus dendritiformis]|uniref:hypothetical protein n=1 Tax=Paenibacillus TaxID=44249 RepID=UPI001B288FCD|nr:hypothetical protein [Paenibacillus dendritiformis]GIO79343.1 hypothetical protein J6TS7_29530 [Paenibacillus dendritiformis]